MFIEGYKPKHRRENKLFTRVKTALVLAVTIFMVHQPTATAVDIEAPPGVEVVNYRNFEELVDNVQIAYRHNSVSRTAERQWQEFDQRLADELAAIEQKKREEEARKKAEAERKAAEEAKKKAEAEAKRWVKPLDNYRRVSSEFGMRTHPITGVHKLHSGLDLSAEVGTKVRSVSSGKVNFAGWDGAYGKRVGIKHWDGTVTWYCHLSTISVDKGEKVAPGEPIGRVGTTGSSTGPHLHLEVRPGNGDPIDPRPWLANRGVSF